MTRKWVGSFWCCWPLLVCIFLVRRGGCGGFLRRQAEVLVVGGFALLCTMPSRSTGYPSLFLAKGAVQKIRGSLLSCVHVQQPPKSTLRLLSSWVRSIFSWGCFKWRGFPFSKRWCGWNPCELMVCWAVYLTGSEFDIENIHTRGVQSGGKPTAAHCSDRGVWPRVPPEMRSSCSFCILCCSAWC